MWILAFLAVSFCIAWLVVGAQLRQRRLRNSEWADLVQQLERVPRIALEKIALDHLRPEGNQTKIEPGEMWIMVGGIEGLRRMRHNADLIIALAAYVRRWNYTEAVIVSERVRHDSFVLKQALFQIQLEILWQFLFHKRQMRSPFYIHQITSAYYLMRQRVLMLYQYHQYILYPRLAEIL
jgi:hypothetical protein